MAFKLDLHVPRRDASTSYLAPNVRQALIDSQTTTQIHKVLAFAHIAR